MAKVVYSTKRIYDELTDIKESSTLSVFCKKLFDYFYDKLSTNFLSSSYYLYYEFRVFLGDAKGIPLLF